jgi:hypothetical protein
MGACEEKHLEDSYEDLVELKMRIDSEIKKVFKETLCSVFF